MGLRWRAHAARAGLRLELVAGVSLLAAFLFTLMCSSPSAQEGPPGITVPVVLPPFNPMAATCTAPAGLQRTLAFAQDNDREFIQGVGRGLAAAARDRGLMFRVAVAENDPAKMIEHVQSLLASKVGAVVAAPVDPPSLGHSLQQIIWSGGYVGTVVPPPATSLLNAPQYLTGKVLVHPSGSEGLIFHSSG